ncbi:Cytochrome c heme lyase subunit CcmH [Rubrivivax sp. A210]|uniref:c-type cytochrome biogenesis protein CcmI n=1 Tax=Rubrivivax sp. A210 TaxID=2772301 RepID=UPI001917B201|nr:c-type cytochrome biogenesis protein CcmI [Rubrivivax sp. A210]CAD5366356.1 Cytochrome c heme lyase subunit CcmH [Rubrivivax sp. A210]
MTSNSAKTTASGTSVLERLKGQLAQIDALIKEGVLTGAAAQHARQALEQQILAQVTGAPAGAAAVAAQRPSSVLIGAVAGFVLLVGLLGYAWRGNHEGLWIAPGDTAGATPTAEGHATGNAEIEALIAKLQERLKAKPDDAEGWSMMGRSYTALSRHAEALAAYKRVIELRPKDAQALADYADGMAVVNNRSLEGEPEKLVQQALALDPANVKALSLAGTAAYNRSDFKGAATMWERAVKASDPAEEFTQQLQGALNAARERAGLSPAPATAAAPPAQAAPATAEAAAPAAAANAFVSGRVSLGAAAKGQVGPDDTVFIFARAPSGSRIPLALLRKQVRDLPLDFRLDDSLAMSPAARLSGSPQVVVGARISKSGSAVPAPGDWQVASDPVALGTQGLKLEIANPVR